MSPTECAWLAGLIEGEGCLDDVRGNPRVRIKMTDADIILRARTLMNGTMYSDDWGSRVHGYRPSWVTQVTGAKAVAVIEAVLPYLGTRRSHRAADIILEYRKRGKHNGQ